jgi:hypothetical protein
MKRVVNIKGRCVQPWEEIYPNSMITETMEKP